MTSRPASKQTHYFAPDRLARRSALLIGLAMTHYLSGLWGRRLRPSAVLIGLYYSAMPNLVCVLFRALRRLAGRTSFLVDSLIDGFFLFALFDIFFSLVFLCLALCVTP